MKYKDLMNMKLQAMKDGDKFKSGVLSVVLAQIKNSAIDKHCRDIVPDELVDVELLKAKKMAKETLDTCPASRPELIEAYKKQLAIIMELAPSLISDANEIRNIVLDALNGEIELIPENKGKIMKIVMPIMKGKVDLAAANKVIGQMIG